MLTESERSARIGRITSSIAAAIFNCDPYTSPYGARRKILGLDEPTPGTAATERGDFCEVACLDYAASRLNASWKKPAFAAHSNGWTGASTDAIFYQEGGGILGLGEAKTVGHHSVDDWGQPLSDHIPDRYLIQCCWHFYHWPNASTCYVPVLFGGYKFSFELYVVRRNDALINQLIHDARRWYEAHIVGDAPLEPDARDYETITKLYPRSGAPVIPMTDSLEALAREKLILASQRRAILYKEQTIKARIIDSLRDHDGARGEHYQISMQARRKPLRVDTSKLLDALKVPLEERAALIAACSDRQEITRSIRVTEFTPKGGDKINE
jgi:hypothetical protein